MMPTDPARGISEEQILTVLAGTPAASVARTYGCREVDLADAVATYRAGGRHALAVAQDETRQWYQANVEPADWNSAETLVATRILPVVRQAVHDGLVSCWWYIRKAPHWRIRLQTTDPMAKNLICGTLDTLARGAAITAWHSALYEPETVAFGGAPGIDIAHRLFHADSNAILGHILSEARQAPLGRRELSLLLCTAMLRAAGQDWHEQGDVWHRVAGMRTPDPDTARLCEAGLINSVRRLSASDASALANPGGPLAPARDWLAAWVEAGQALQRAAQQGALARGLRGVLAHHVVFHWNRLGLPDRTQAILAHAARKAHLGE